MDLKDYIRDIPDFPEPGILFRDITTLLREPKAFQHVLDCLVEEYKDQQIDYVAGIESRGFIFGTPLALQLGCGFVPIRKPGKLPAATFSESYTLEYGKNTLEIHQDAFGTAGSRVLIIDDLLATGGTAVAAGKLVQKAGGTLAGFGFIIELTFLNGRAKLLEDVPAVALVSY